MYYWSLIFPNNIPGFQVDIDPICRILKKFSEGFSSFSGAVFFPKLSSIMCYRNNWYIKLSSYHCCTNFISFFSNKRTLVPSGKKTSHLPKANCFGASLMIICIAFLPAFRLIWIIFSNMIPHPKKGIKRSSRLKMKHTGFFK